MTEQLPDRIVRIGIDLSAWEPLYDPCRVCGCTASAACWIGCAWAEPGLCTACVPVDDPIVRQFAHDEGLDGWSALLLVEAAIEQIDLFVFGPPIETITVRDGLL